MSMLFITHDLGIVRRVADRVCVMQHGRIVEQGPTEQVFSAPQHPYTQMLLAAEPAGAPEPLPEAAPEVLQTDSLRVWFPIQRGLLRRTVGHIRAVNGASSACARARRWAWWANPARARRRSRWRSCG
jgi:microcin C transport system ATP-binding protein